MSQKFVLEFAVCSLLALNCIVEWHTKKVGFQNLDLVISWIKIYCVSLPNAHSGGTCWGRSHYKRYVLAQLTFEIQTKMLATFERSCITTENVQTQRTLRTLTHHPNQHHTTSLPDVVTTFKTLPDSPQNAVSPTIYMEAKHCVSQHKLKPNYCVTGSSPVEMHS